MNLREWPLAAFTLLMQASVGIVLVRAVLPLVHAAHPKGGGPARPLAGRLDTLAVVAAAAAALALLASLLHLGQPVLAWLALANVRGSWLSREVALAVVFVAALAASSLSPAGDRWAPAFRTAATALAVAAGLALVFAMARVYMMAGQPAWDRPTTLVAFFTSTLLLGTVAVVACPVPRLEPRATRLLGTAAIALLALQVLLVPPLLAVVAAEPAAAISPASLGHAAMWLAAARVVAAVAGAGLLVSALRAGPGVHRGMGGARYAALALVVVSEVFGRMLFYATSVRLGPV